MLHFQSSYQQHIAIITHFTKGGSDNLSSLLRETQEGSGRCGNQFTNSHANQHTRTSLGWLTPPCSPSPGLTPYLQLRPTAVKDMLLEFSKQTVQGQKINPGDHSTATRCLPVGDGLMKKTQVFIFLLAAKKELHGKSRQGVNPFKQQCMSQLITSQQGAAHVMRPLLCSKRHHRGKEPLLPG